MGRRNRVWCKGKDSQFLKFTDWIEKPKESILAVTLEIKAARKSTGWARQKARHIQPPAGRAQQRGPRPSLWDCPESPGHRHRTRALPTATRGGPCLKIPPLIFFLLTFFIFYFWTDSDKKKKGCGKRAPAAALPLTSALNPLPTLIEWVLRMWLCNTAISKQCFW